MEKFERLKMCLAHKCPHVYLFGYKFDCTQWGILPEKYAWDRIVGFSLIVCIRAKVLPDTSWLIKNKIGIKVFCFFKCVKVGMQLDSMLICIKINATDLRENKSQVRAPL